MPSLTVIIPAALAAALLWTALGWPIARRLVPPALVAGVAPTLGWAVYSTTALPVLTVVGFSWASAAIFTLACAATSAWMWTRRSVAVTGTYVKLPLWAWGLAALLAALPALAIVPKFADGGVLLGPPVFDHVKIAMIDGMTRQGLPPVNMFFTVAGQASHLSYYYLWHFSAAVLSKILGISGWTADIAMTWFTAFASALLMMSLAVHMAGRTTGALLVALLSIPASMRPVLAWIFGKSPVERVMPPNADIGAWVNQASWVPQHLASACCVVLAALLMMTIDAAGMSGAVALGLVAAAGFESSTWVGGIAFAVASALAAPLLLAHTPPARRWMFVRNIGVAAGVAAVLVAPFLLSQAQTLAARGGGFPIAFMPYHAFAGGGRLVGLLAFWPLTLPFNLPALVPAGAIGLLEAARARNGRSRMVMVLGCFAIACLSVTWLMRSTIENNDLGWRAAIPALLILTPFAATAWSGWLTRPWRLLPAAALFLAILGLPQAGQKFAEALFGQRPADARGFAASADLWQAVRAHSAPADRVGNSPLMLADLTPWPDDISWALLSDRPSCYPGWATAIAYAGVSRDTLVTIETQFKRVFAGGGQPGDVDALAWHFDCKTIVLTASDPAWSHDPFAGSAAYHLEQERPNQWRLYSRRP